MIVAGDLDDMLDMVGDEADIRGRGRVLRLLRLQRGVALVRLPGEKRF